MLLFIFLICQCAGTNPLACALELPSAGGVAQLPIFTSPFTYFFSRAYIFIYSRRYVPGLGWIWV